MKKLRIVSQFFALASFVLWGTAALSETIVQMISDGGTFRVPVTINDELTLKFVIDSGAADVSVPADVVMTLVRTGTITVTDFLGKQTYTLADGSTVPSQQFVIRSLKVGDRTLENVTGSIAPVAGTLLLGQSFLTRFNSWSIDNQRRALILNPTPMPLVEPSGPTAARPSASGLRPPPPPIIDEVQRLGPRCRKSIPAVTALSTTPDGVGHAQIECDLGAVKGQMVYKDGVWMRGL
jgi:gag-polyprotein putative aspartyl protease